MSTLPFKRLAKYRVDSAVGVGGMGAVYRGFDEDIDRMVAIKIIHPHLRAGELGDELERRFKNEAKAAARCMHPNIVTVFDYGFADGVPYLVMEYVEGVELKELLKDSERFSVRQAVDITLQLAEALGYAHQQGVVHRDVKPANVMILKTGLVKLSDFGVAHLDSSDLTRAGNVIGTPNYMSPEGLRGQPVDARSDLFSLALMLLELASGKRLNANEVAPKTVQNHLRVAARTTPEIIELEPTLQIALQLNPDDRFESAAQFAAGLKQSSGEPSLSATEMLAETVLHSQAFQRKPTPRNSVDAAASAASSWQPEVLRELENQLAKYLGPLARIVVRKHADDCESFAALTNTLASHIQQRDERDDFLQTLDASSISRLASKDTPAGAPPAARAAAAALDISQVDSDALVRNLSEYMGPLAAQMVKAELRRVSDVGELYRQLARKIPNKKEQQQFLSALRA